MNNPKPTVTSQRTSKRHVEMKIDDETLAEIVRSWLIKTYPQFRGFDHINVEFKGVYSSDTFSHAFVSADKETSS